MIIKIEQVSGANDPSPEKEALLNVENIAIALNMLFPDEKFSVLEVREISEYKSKSSCSVCGCNKLRDEPEYTECINCHTKVYRTVLQHKKERE